MLSSNLLAAKSAGAGAEAGSESSGASDRTSAAAESGGVESDESDIVVPSDDVMSAGWCASEGCRKLARISATEGSAAAGVEGADSCQLNSVHSKERVPNDQQAQ